MTDVIAAHPEIGAFLDGTDDFDIRTEEFSVEGVTYLRVTQTSEFEGGQVLLRWNGSLFELAQADTVVGLSGFTATSKQQKAIVAAGVASDADHAAIHSHQLSQVNVFSSAAGPDGGNLACVWAVRTLAHQALGRWITRTDGTAVFAPELKQATGPARAEADVMAGGIVISPTRTLNSGARNVGHVGILGQGSGPNRPVYSNSSSRARWEKNFTVQSWIDRYQTRKGLPVLFFPLPA